MLYFAKDRLLDMDHVEVWGYQVHNHLYPNIAIDISDQIDTKREMIDQFVSQNSNFKDYSHLTVGLNAYNSKFLKGAKYCELFFGLPLKRYIEFIERFYKNNEEEIYRGEKNYIENILALEAQIHR
jgi:hypothetical protein